jgi:hypothetical protein
MESSPQQLQPDESERRRTGGRRATDQPVLGRSRAFVWALAGALVVLFLFFVAIGGINPKDARAVSIVALVLAVLWLAHSWRRMWSGPTGFVSRPDRERRGF